MNYRLPDIVDKEKPVPEPPPVRVSRLPTLVTKYSTIFYRAADAESIFPGTVVSNGHWLLASNGQYQQDWNGLIDEIAAKMMYLAGIDPDDAPFAFRRDGETRDIVYSPPRAEKKVRDELLSPWESETVLQGIVRQLEWADWPHIPRTHAMACTNRANRLKLDYFEYELAVGEVFYNPAYILNILAFASYQVRPNPHDSTMPAAIVGPGSWQEDRRLVGALAPHRVLYQQDPY